MTDIRNANLNPETRNMKSKGNMTPLVNNFTVMESNDNEE
jgi:hypothetical protein